MRSSKTQNKFLASLLTIATSALFLTTPLNAAEISSTYTELNLDECVLLSNADLGLPELTEEEMGVSGGRFLCAGYNNSVVFVAEGDLRMFVSYGGQAMQERAASQTLPQFNTINSTLEWRVTNQTGNWVPFATILRWETQVGDGSAPDGEVLIVTKLEPGNTCHVAYIDAKLTPNANEVARLFADNQVADFDCATDEIHFVPS